MLTIIGIVGTEQSLPDDGTPICDLTDGEKKYVNQGAL